MDYDPILDTDGLDVDQLIADFTAELNMVHLIHSNYISLQNGMDLSCITDGDLRRIVSEYNLNTFGLEELIDMPDHEQYKAFINTTPYAFALEGLESVLDWSVFSQVMFIAFFPFGYLVWCTALIERIWRESKIIMEEREKLREQGFYAPDANPDDFRGNEDMNEKQMKKYLQASVKAYPAKLLLEKLEASYTLMRIFCDGAQNNTKIKPRQLIPSLKRLGYVVDEQRGKINQDPNKKIVKGTMQELGYSDPSFIKHLFAKTEPHTTLLPEFHKAMEKAKEEAKKQDSVVEKLKRFFKVTSKEQVSKQDKAAIALVAHALKVTLEETDIIFKQTIQLLSVVYKYEK